MAVDAQLGADIHTIENGASLLAIGCMRGRGFDYRPTIDEVKPRDPLAMGDLDPGMTTRVGYTISPHLDGGLTTDEMKARPEEKYVSALPKQDVARYNHALLGGDTKSPHAKPGCLGIGRRQAAGGSFNDWVQLSYAVSDQTALVDEELRASKKWKAADSRWSKCMAERGFDYGSPEDAVNDAYERFNVEHRKSATKAERALATADAKCRQEINFVRLTIELSEPFERLALTRIEPKVLAWMAERDRVLAHVEAELAKAGR